MLRTSLSIAAFCLLFPAALPSSAFAQDKSAEDIKKEADAALASSDLQRACLLYEEAYGIASKAPADAPGPKPMELLFSLADCHEKQGFATLAASEFEQVAGSGATRAEEAKSRAAKLRSPTPPPKEDPKPPVEEPKTPPDTKPVPEVPVTPPAEPKKENPTRIGDFMDTRLTWVFGDDDVLKQTGQAFPLSPLISVGERKQYRMFFDSLNSRFAGRENLTHLALYKKMPGFIEDLDTEASDRKSVV